MSRVQSDPGRKSIPNISSTRRGVLTAYHIGRYQRQVTRQVSRKPNHRGSLILVAASIQGMEPVQAQRLDFPAYRFLICRNFSGIRLGQSAYPLSSILAMSPSNGPRRLVSDANPSSDREFLPTVSCGSSASSPTSLLHILAHPIWLRKIDRKPVPAPSSSIGGKGMGRSGLGVVSRSGRCRRASARNKLSLALASSTTLQPSVPRGPCPQASRSSLYRCLCLE